MINNISNEELTKINEFSRKNLTPQEVYTFSLILCDNETDRDCERFSIPALETLSKLFVGKTGIFDHSLRSGDQSARIFETMVISDNERKTSCGENYTYILAKAYMIKSEKNKDLIEEIEGGIKKETSVNCAVEKIECSVCGKDIRSSECPHRKGEIYNSQKCVGILTNPTDAYEFSFVAVPAQRNAGVTKHFKVDLTDEFRKEIKELIAQEFKKRFETGKEEKPAPLIPQLQTEQTKKDNGNNEYII